jgi:dTMP kinase
VRRADEPLSRRGSFIVLEGGEGSGKSTQARLLADELGAALTREPGGTAIGETVRDVLLDRRVDRIDAKAELMLMLADRAQHVVEYLVPTLEQGHDVVCDRFSPSTLAYQGYGRGLDLSAIRVADEFARSGLEPDLVVLLDLEPEIASKRRARQPDRIEGEDDEFFVRVRNGYLALAEADPEHFVVIDAGGSIAEVRDRVLSAVRGRALTVSQAAKS